MPHNLHGWIRRIRSIEVDHTCTRLALDRLLDEDRLFAEFETGLRLYWSTIRETEPPAQHLLDGIAARRGISPDRLAGAHAVREYRNSLVHERDEAMISIAEARGHLCRFFAFLPPVW
jgi:hypothetical protein